MLEPLLALTELHVCTNQSGTYSMSSESSYSPSGTEGESSETTEGEV